MNNFVNEDINDFLKPKKEDEIFSQILKNPGKIELIKDWKKQKKIIKKFLETIGTTVFLYDDYINDREDKPEFPPLYRFIEVKGYDEEDNTVFF